jgi:hypothetical protein
MSFSCYWLATKSCPDLTQAKAQAKLLYVIQCPYLRIDITEPMNGWRLR